MKRGVDELNHATQFLFRAGTYNEIVSKLEDEKTYFEKAKVYDMVERIEKYIEIFELLEKGEEYIDYEDYERTFESFKKVKSLAVDLADDFLITKIEFLIQSLPGDA